MVNASSRLWQGIALMFVGGLVLMAPRVAASQEEETLPEVASLRTPTSPAFILLGVEPTAITRPTTPSAVALSMLNSTQNATTIPTDFAMEFSPFWLASHPTSDWRDDLKRTVDESLLRTFTVSLATAEVGGVDNPNTGLSLGAKASLFSGSVPQEQIDQLDALQSLLSDRSKAVLRAQKKMTRDAWRALNDEERTLLTDQEMEAGAKQALEEYDDFEIERSGFMWDVAGGSVWSFPDQVAANGKFRGWALWTSLAYRINHLSVLGVARYWDNELLSTDTTFDWGTRILTEGSSYGASFEVLQRQTKGAENEYRYIFFFEYKVFGNTWANFSFGENFDREEPGSFVALLGLTLNFAQSRQVVPGG